MFRYLPAAHSLRIAAILAVLVAGFAAGPAHAQVQAMGAGLAWIDSNQDGHLDILHLTPVGDIRLLVFNENSGGFVDQTDSAIPSGLFNPISPVAALGIACGDLNNDGWEDIVISRAGPNLVLLNRGDGTYESVGRAVGIKGAAGEGDRMTSSIALFDYNNDNLLDIYLVNYEGFSNQLFRNEGIDTEGMPSFTDVAAELGVARTDVGSNWGLGVATADYDNDGDVDLYVANDYNGVNTDDPDFRFLNPGDNVLYRNEGDGTFTDVSYIAGAAEPGWAMGVAFGDYNQDGHLDIFLSNFWGDALLENDGNGNFTDVAAEVGIIQDGVWDYNGWGTAFVDYDNDGDLDIHVSNGFIPNDQCNPALVDTCIVNESHPDYDPSVFQVDDEPNQLWENRGPDGNGVIRFVEVGAPAGIDDIGDARGASYGDFNRDGFVDLAVINNDYVADGQGENPPQPAPVRLLYVNQGDGTFHEKGASLGLRNDGFADGNKPTSRGNFTANDWITVQVVGSPDHPVVMGARVTVEAGGKSWIQELGASSYCSQNSPELHFGLGNNPVVSRVTVRYPDGFERVLTNVTPNQRVTVNADPTPVRLLAFSLRSGTYGVRMTWSYGDDGDAAGFLVRRLDGADARTFPWIPAADGRGSFLDEDAPVGRDLTYTLTAVHRDGNAVELRRETIRHAPVLPARLLQNHPNPFRAGTRIPVAGTGRTVVDIFGVDGRLLRTLSGEGDLSWDGRDAEGRALPAGTYFYRSRGTDRTMKMIRRP